MSPKKAASPQVIIHNEAGGVVNVDTETVTLADENVLLKAALKYGREGISIFPCLPKSKHPAIKDNLNAATTNENTIRAWFAQWPDANIGMPTGLKNNRYVIDVDGPEGEASLAKLSADYEPLPETLEIRTGRADGGRHLHHKISDIETKSKASLLGPHLDGKGDGGFVLLPPSIHPDTGQEYYVVHNRQPSALSQWLVTKIRKEAPKQKTSSTTTTDGEPKIPKGGGQNNYLASCAGRYRRAGDGPDVIYQKLLIDYRESCAGPHDAFDEVRKIADGFKRYEPVEEDQTIFEHDVANAALLAKMGRGFIVYCTERMIWYAWDGKRLAENNQGEVMRRSRDVVSVLYAQAYGVPDDKDHEDARKAKFRRAHAAESNIEKFVRYAQSETALEAINGLTEEQTFWLLQGQSKTGKTTFVNIVRGLMGEYATTLPESAVMMNPQGNQEHGLAQLANVRLATLTELGQGKLYDEAQLKKITGQDWIGASKKYQNFFEFRSSAKIMMAGNFLPRVRDTDDSIWNRIRRVPLNVFVPPEKRIKDLDVKLLTEEGSGILNLAAAGFRRWRAKGFNEPEEVKKATSEYRAGQDLVLSFIEDECERSDDYKERASALFNSFTAWKKNNGILSQYSKKQFGEELGRLGFKPKKSGEHFWIGLRLVLREVLYPENEM